ncbi:hypothetical protein ORL47_08145 [Klebsiella oxytoca]|nr:hypothetical protein [Klebsiella oxytoca]MCW1902841.1 hypothetical protein [Klebsiella oxytoca]MCW9552819.1 hypothetical protein [Klebsiella oxytoca]MDU6020664.1 hypothetical protein [Klebsiella oxytoca]HBL7065598.1 hypothetical protein [Klebsiella oxytoca]
MRMHFSPPNRISRPILMRLRVDAGEEKEQKTGLWHPVLDESTKRSTNLSPRFSGTTQYPDPARVAGDNAQLNQISPVAARQHRLAQALAVFSR